MQFLSNRLELVATSATAKIHNLILKKQHSGEEVINLSVGESDFNTPENVKDAACQAIATNQTRYTSTAGLEKLKTSISKKFSIENSLEYKNNELIICTGGKQVIYNALLATLNSNDEVVIPAPYWVSYPDIVTLCGGTPVTIETNINNNFKIKPQDLERSLNLKSKWFILNSPSNPTGSVYTKKELTDLSDVLEHSPHVNIISDDIYEHITFEDAPFYNIVQINPKLKNRTLIVNGVSKSYAMTGWRIGYGAGNKNLIEAMTTVQSQSTSNANSIGQHAAVEALENCQSFIVKNKKIYQKRRDLTITILSKCECIEIMKPMGTFYALPSIHKLIGKITPKGKIISSDPDFVFELLAETGVAVVPGSAFGMKNTFRISYAVSESLLEEACNLIVKFVNNLK